MVDVSSRFHSNPSQSGIIYYCGIHPRNRKGQIDWWLLPLNHSDPLHKSMANIGKSYGPWLHPPCGYQKSVIIPVVEWHENHKTTYKLLIFKWFLSCFIIHMIIIIHEIGMIVDETNLPETFTQCFIVLPCYIHSMIHDSPMILPLLEWSPRSKIIECWWRVGSKVPKIIRIHHAENPWTNQIPSLDFAWSMVHISMSQISQWFIPLVHPIATSTIPSQDSPLIFGSWNGCAASEKESVQNPEVRMSILQDTHDSPIASSPGRQKTPSENSHRIPPRLKLGGSEADISWGVLVIQMRCSLIHLPGQSGEHPGKAMEFCHGKLGKNMRIMGKLKGTKNRRIMGKLKGQPRANLKVCCGEPKTKKTLDNWTTGEFCSSWIDLWKTWNRQLRELENIGHGIQIIEDQAHTPDLGQFWMDSKNSNCFGHQSNQVGYIFC